MSRRDALATVLLLRRQALDAARQDFAACQLAQAQAEAAAARAAAALQAEAAAGASVGDYAAWLPRGRAAAIAADAAATDAARHADLARQALRDARIEVERAEALAERRAAAARVRLLQREQAALDEFAGRRHGHAPD